MAVRFAVASTPWSNPATWDDGIGPVAGDTVYPNGFTIPIDTDISVASLNNGTPPVYLPNMNIPAMTSNTQPSGVADSSGYSLSYYPYLAFDQNSGTTWASNAALGWISYDYGSNKLIKRYFIKQISLTGYSYPTGWTFEGWNGTSWDPLEIKSGMGTTVQSTGYLSPVLPHSTQYSKYRLNIQTTNNVANVSLTQFEMTESVSTTYGTGTAGSFTVPASLSGTRNIEFSGDGIRIAGSTTCINIAATTGATVNFNRISGGEIFKPIWSVSNGTNGRGVSINGNCAVVFNGNIQGTTASAYNDGASGNIYINAAATVTINGNVIAPTISPTYPSYLIQSAASTSNNAILNINGDIIAGTQNTTYALFLNGINTVNITSNNITASQGYLIFASSTTVYLTIVGNISYTNASSITPITLGGASSVSLTGTLAAPPNAVGISTSGSGAITITGAMTGGTGGTNGACIVSTGTGAINIPTGTITNGTNASAISAVSSSLVTVGNSPIINSNNFMAIYAPRIRFYTGAQIEWTFQTSTGGTKVLRNGTNAIGLPSYIHVKSGQHYGPNGDFVGACVIPPASAVGVGIPVSSITPENAPVPVIVGTLQLTGEDILNAISTSSNVVATRLKNVATVETTGDQLAAFNRI